MSSLSAAHREESPRPLPPLAWTAALPLVEYHRHIGGMAASGLGKSDIENRAAIAGLFREFTDRVLGNYIERYGPESENVALCRDGDRSEPSVAETVFLKMLATCGEDVLLLCGFRLQTVLLEGGAVTAIEVMKRSTAQVRRLEGGVFIDATYEGDLYAAAGADFRVGRESRDETGSRTPGLSTSTTRIAGSFREPPARETTPFRPTPTASA